MIRLSLIGVRVEVPTNQPIVLLREEEGTRFLPIFIGSPEATAIVYALQGLATPRPLTHDLFKTVLDDLSVKLERRDQAARRRSTPRSSSTGRRQVTSRRPPARSRSQFASGETSRSSPTRRSTKPGVVRGRRRGAGGGAVPPVPRR